MIRHDSMRGEFAYELYKAMKKNKNIILIVGDLGYKVFDQIKDEMPDQFINTGAAEQAMMGIAAGLALEGKIPFVYSITPFLIYRPFETLRTYIDHEKIPVKLIGSGRDKDYAHDGFSHDATDVHLFLKEFKNIYEYYPNDKKKIPELVKELINNNMPTFLSLRR